MDLLWKYLTENDLIIDSSNISEFLKCDLCSCIMKQSVVTTCGCTFCEYCIFNYLGEERKPCPACAKDNIITELCYIDVLECRNANKEISKSTVKCPQVGCEATFELRSLLDHLESCHMKRENCILSNLGCSNINMKSSMMNTHLKEDLKMHFQLIAENLCIYRNQMESLQVELVKINELRVEVDLLKSNVVEMRQLQNDSSMEVQAAEGKIDTLKTDNFKFCEVIKQYMSEISSLRNGVMCLAPNITSIEAEMKILREQISKGICALKLEQENMIIEIVAKNKNESSKRNLCNQSLLESEIRILTEKISQEVGKLTQENANLKMELSQLKNDLHTEKLGRERDQVRMEQIEKSMVPLKNAVEAASAWEPTNAKRYHWIPTQLSQYCGKERWSDIFFIKGYSITVWMVWSKHNLIGTWLFLVRSSDNDKVVWPMRLRLRLRLTDPDSRADIESVMIDCNCDKPTTEKVYIGGSSSGWVSLNGYDGVKRTDSVSIIVEMV